MARAQYQQTVGTTALKKFDANEDRVYAKEIRVFCDAASDAPLVLRVPALHGSDTFTLAAGESVPLVASEPPYIDQLWLNGSGGTATYSFLVTAI
jgi:hypothetical protein